MEHDKQNKSNSAPTLQRVSWSEIPTLRQNGLQTSKRKLLLTTTLLRIQESAWEASLDRGGVGGRLQSQTGKNARHFAPNSKIWGGGMFVWVAGSMGSPPASAAVFPQVKEFLIYLRKPTRKKSQCFASLTRSRSFSFQESQGKTACNSIPFCSAGYYDNPKTKKLSTGEQKCLQLHQSYFS